jgi:L-ascorbate metabolism protein UlaG (beta-lactamase superfamily)
MNKKEKMTGTVTFRWLGVAGIELNIDGQILTIDPLFTRPPLHRLFVGRVESDTGLVHEKLPHCDHILVSHTHWDHVINVPDLAKQTGAFVYGSPNTCKLLSACGVPVRQINQVEAGDKLLLGKTSVRVFLAEHLKIPGFTSQPVAAYPKPPLRLRDYRMDYCYSFLIETDGLSLLDWCGIQTQTAPQATILFFGLSNKIASFETLLKRVKPCLVIPLHWDNPFHPLSKPVRHFFQFPIRIFPILELMDPKILNRIVSRTVPTAKVLIPEIFHTYNLSEYS